MARNKKDEGLTSEAAAERLGRFGPNEITSNLSRPFWRIAWETAKEPMFLLLIACASLYLALGDKQEAMFLGSAVLAVIAITLVQERRTERTLEALRDLSSPRALVIRDGKPLRIAGREVVPDDVVLIGEGDRVPADAAVLESHALRVDESLLTGESVHVAKGEWNGSDPIGPAGGEGVPFVYSGTLVVQGRGVVRVLATGGRTALGRIGASLATTDRPISALQSETRRVVRLVAAASIGVSIILALVWWLRDGDLLRGILTGLTFAMATIPEEFPVVLTVFMALGAWRISRQRVLTRQVNAIEALGSATFLCVDKTGTLTMNRMSVATTADGDAAAIVRWGAAASDAGSPDPMDQALVEVARARGLVGTVETTHLRTYPLSKDLLAVGHAWADADGSVAVAVKGAPEAVIGLCALDEARGREVRASVDRLAVQGYRVLGVASGAAPAAPERLTDVRFSFVGLVAFADPLRPGVVEAVRQCHDAGIKVMMITGDYPATATSIARAAGLEQPEDTLTGAQVAQLDDETLSARLTTVRVLARMVPEQKLRVVQALRRRGEVVAMTGDGVNDAPALKAAHIGIAMGGRGTDVAREAAALVLLDDDFGSIVAAISLGRRIYDNIQKAVSYIIAIHVPIVGLATVPVLLGMPVVLMPMHLAFLELIIDPVCSIAFEAEPAEKGIMRRRPRSATARLFDRSVMVAGLGEGLALLVAAFLVYLFATLGGGHGEDDARTMAFTTLLLGNLGMILSLRSRTEIGLAVLRRPSKTLVLVAGSLLAIAAVILFEPHAMAIFHFKRMHFVDLLVCVGAALASLAWFELAKVWRR